jgi:peptidoglycan-N-acetylglucosamine deacetylase
MGRRWNWDFEDEPRPRRAAPAPPSLPRLRESRLARKIRFRRRRAIAAIIALALLLAILVATLSGAHHSSASKAAASGGARPAATTAAHAGRAPKLDEDRVVSAVLAYTPFIKEGTPRARDIALTFDDGPGPYTPGILAALEREHVRATFFAIGAMFRYFSASTVREVHDGDVIGDHTETHPELAALSAHEQHEQLFEQIARLELLDAPRPHLFRPPYGSFNATTLHELHNLRLLMVLWSVDTGDYLKPGVPAIVQRVLAGARPGAIILMHDGGGDRSQTIAALPVMIRELRARGYRLVTVPELLMNDPPPRGQPLPGSLSGD